MSELLLWATLGLPTKATQEEYRPVRRVKGAFSKDGRDEKLEARRGQQLEKDRVHRAGLLNKGRLQLCKRCEKNPRGVTSGFVKLAYCRSCSTELMREYRARIKRGRNDQKA